MSQEPLGGRPDSLPPAFRHFPPAPETGRLSCHRLFSAWPDRRVTGEPARLGRAKCVLFDVDGTLIDAVRNQRQVWGIWAERYGLNAAA